MLPSTGYFKAINCPFYDSGLCERPYCHFKHPRRDDGSTATVPPQSVASIEGEKTSISQPSSNTLQELVSQAVKKVLAVHEVTETGEIPDNIVSRVVEELNPTLSSASSSVSHQELLIAQPPVQPTPCVYNPTPIAELKKRHIPVVPYMPTRESKVAVKRKSSPERFKPWLSIAREVTSSSDKTTGAPSYSTVKLTEITYKPTAISNSGGDPIFVQSYIPTIKSDSSSPNSYEDGNSSDYIFKTKDEYRPRSKKRREEYVPKKLKVPLNTARQIVEPVVTGQFPRTDLSAQVEKILNADKESDGRLQAQEFQDDDIGIEPQFSDEEVQNVTADKSIKEASKTDQISAGTDKSDEKSRSNHKSSSRSNSNSKSKDNVERRSSLTKDREKSKDKSDRDRSRKERKSSSTNDQDKDSKDSGSGERSKDKEKHRHSSSSKEKRHSTSSDKSRATHGSKDRKESKREEKGSESRSKNSSRSSRGKSEERYKSGSRDKHKSKSSSSSSRDRHSSNKSDRKLSKSSTKSSSSSRKSESKKKSNDDASSTEDHDEKENSPSLRFRSTSPYSEEILEISDSDHDIEEECLKIFQEYEVSEHPKEPTRKEQPCKEPEEAEEPGKKRVAHASASQYSELKRLPVQPQKVMVNPQLKLMERWRLRKEAMAEKVATVSAAPAASQENSAPQSLQQREQQQPSSNSGAKSDQLLNGNGRLRIAHVPYATSLALAKKKVSQAMNKNVENKTVAQTAKGGSRVAHVPQVIPQLIRPEPLQVATQKFPLNVRQYYVNMMQDVCIQIYTNGEDAAQRALREEFACHERCKAVAVYKNSCMLATHRLRKELDQRSTNEGGSACATGTVSHEAVLAGKSRGSWSVIKTKRSITELKGATLYAMLSKWIMTEEQLRENGFPRPHPDGPTGRVKIYVTNTRNQTILSKVPNERFCSRCNQPYMVDKHGNCVVQQNCIYHWGRKFTIRGEGKYSCCQQYGSATGCCDAKTHVWDYVDYENLRGYVQTFPKDNVPVEEQGVFALDCEMSYTTQGLELTRVTVINEECNVVYETLVKPDHPVIDYNTRFSGITEQNMEGVTTTLLDVQATLLSMFSEKTILIGHSLESDFKALKLLHETVVDTSVMFPHRNGYPLKRALRNLCSEYLQKIIQNDVGGHDSKEDAVSCMELVLWKLKEEAKSL